MLLNLKNIFVTDGDGFDFNYEMNLSKLEMAKGEYPFKEPVGVSGGVRNRAGVVTLKATVKFRYFTHCDRCFKEIAEQNEVSFENVLTPVLESEDSDELLLVENDQLDLDELVVSNVILSLPMKHLCSRQCKGLCPVCGKNLNDGPCGCGEKQVDAGLASLKDFIQ